MSFPCPPSQAAPSPPDAGVVWRAASRCCVRRQKEPVKGPERRPTARALPPKGRHDARSQRQENVERSADSLAYHAGEQ